MSTSTMSSATDLLDSYLQSRVQPRGSLDDATVVSVRNGQPAASVASLVLHTRPGDGSHVRHRSDLASSSIGKPLQDLVNRVNNLGSSLSTSHQQLKPVCTTSKDFMSDLAALRAKYLANAPRSSIPARHSHGQMEVATSSQQRSLKSHHQRLWLSNSKQGTSDVVTDLSAPERSSFRHVESQPDTIAAWRRSQSSVGAASVHPNRAETLISRSQSHSRLLKECMPPFNEPVLPRTSRLEEPTGPFMRILSSSGDAERDLLQENMPVPSIHEQHPKASRCHSPLRASQGISSAFSDGACPQEVASVRQSSASGYVNMEQSTPPPLGSSWAAGEASLHSSVGPTRTPLTDCLRDFFAQRAASRDLEYQDQEAAAQHADVLQQHEGTELSSSSCRVAAAAEARMRTAGALQVAHHVHQSARDSLVGPGSLAWELHLPSPTLRAAPSLPCDVRHSAALSVAASAPYETCNAAQKVRERYPEIFRSGQSPSFRSAWRAPDTTLPISCAHSEVSMSIHHSTDVHVHASGPSTFTASQGSQHGSPIDFQTLGQSDSAALAAPAPPSQEHSPSAGQETSVYPSSTVASCAREDWASVSAAEPMLVTGLSQRAQKLLSTTRVRTQDEVAQLQEGAKVDASVDHWVATKRREASVGRLRDVLRACGLSDDAVEEIMSSQTVQA